MAGTPGEREIAAEDSIKVVCRFRPLNDSEEKAGSKFVVKFPSGGDENCISIAVSICCYELFARSPFYHVDVLHPQNLSIIFLTYKLHFANNIVFTCYAISSFLRLFKSTRDLQNASPLTHVLA